MMKAINPDSTKIELIKWISGLTDEKILHVINSFRVSSATNKDWWLDLTEEQQKEIDSSIKDLNRGSGISSKEFWEKHGDVK